MRYRLAKLWMAVLLAAIPSAALAAEWIVTPSDGPALSAVLEAAAPGDQIRLKAGRHDGPLVIDKPVTLDGEDGASIVGNGKGSVVTIKAAQVAVRGIAVTGSGMNLSTLDSGIFAARTATGAIIENNTLTGNLFGIYLHGAKDSLARENVIVGLKDGRMSEFGSGISVWNAPGGKVIDNDISFGRDGIATMASKKNVFSGNRFRDLRFAIHYMYTNDSVISGNVSTGNSVGYAIMFSNRLKIIDNISDGDRDHGLLLNSANGSTISGNIVRGRLQPADRWTMAGIQDSGHGVKDDAGTTGAVEGGMRLGPEKCVFIYNANRNKLRGNEFRGCAIGIHFTAGSEGNTMTGNAFIDNRNQVKYVGTRYLDWSVNGRGNYWSDNPAFDLDGDGIGDSAYRPNDLMDKVLWTSPQAKILTSSPAVQIIRWAQVQFPALLPGGVVDSRPLMAPTRQKDGLQ
ncbi:nitrous oxide reductase family maturation protein NosD [Pararhizobium sp. O133]|uniref:nitrous oxide reductase family maturation protein NosD n=1 Tax=Pararhizobium sp. O133 TaxID=3449278 RepID=UPI003F684432